MRPTLRHLLDRPDLHLTLVEAGAGAGAGAGTGAGAGDTDALDLPLDWVHGSDLLDPTPFLADGQLVLTTGTQFTGRLTGTPSDYMAYAAYVDRLVARGVRGLGFGTEVIRAGTPAELVDACRAASLPLFEVPYRTPFIAVVRAVADLIDRDVHERDDWARTAQRALSLAALRTDPVAAVLAELQRQLGHPVALVAGDGMPRADDSPTAPASPASPAIPAVPTPVLAEARRLLGRGQRASSTVTVDADTPVTLQTIGRSDALLGILAVSADARTGLDRAAQSVITGVVALLGLALEHDRSRAGDGIALRSALLAEALGGDPETAARIGGETGNPFPTGTLLVARLRQAASESDALLRETSGRRPSDHVFATRTADGLVLCGRAERVTALADGAVTRGAAAGVSRPFALPAARTAPAAARTASAPAGTTPSAATHDGTGPGIGIGTGPDRPHPLATAATEARIAVERATAGHLVRVDDLAHGGVRSAVDPERMRVVAASLLGPLREHDARSGSRLLEASRTWLENNGQWEPAAAALGMHRHTLKARIRQVEQLTGTPLDTFGARTELWLALTADDLA